MAMTATVAEDVADAVLRWFHASAECQKKVPLSQWTVLAGIVAVTSPSSSPAHDDSRDGSSKPSVRVLAAATGNKCLGRRDLHAQGLVVNDCHAEVLARRALLRYLYTEALAWAAGREDINASLFERHPVTQRLVLKAQHKLHLYISEVPCGDAAIYQLRDDVVDELVKQRVERTADNGSSQSHAKEAVAALGIHHATDEERSAFRLTGAKAKRKRDDPTNIGEQEGTGDCHTHDLQLQPQEKRFDQMVGIARVKSGRSDLPADKQTLSMSCSDKIAKWNATGVQGMLLLQFFEPLFLKSIVVSLDDASISVATQHEALERAVFGRFQQQQQHLGDSVALQSPCEVHVVPHSAFQRKRTKERAPSSLALNWTLREAHWKQAISSSCSSVVADPTDKAQECQERDRSNLLLKFFQNSDVEVLMAATGLKQGAKKIAKMSVGETQKVASRLTKWTLFLAFHRIVSMEKLRTSNSCSDDKVTQTAVPLLPYLQQKEAIPMDFCTSSSSPSTLSSETETATQESVQRVRERRKQFIAAIAAWVGVPASFKLFTL